ncbi:MAG: PBP1A family penicillin-binding protein [Patescibacteria group bacterium]|nr:PBP1A family penicillin-binding protein [Patescibacteria group bacterium]
MIYYPKKIGWHSRKIRRFELRKYQKRKKKKFLKTIFLLFLFLTLLVGIFLSLFFVWVSKDLPDPDKLLAREISQSTKIYDREGKTVLYEIFTEERRTLVELSEIPKNLIWATIAAEDRYFYEHKGFNLKSIVRAILINLLKGGKIQGGSTITQQLIKNAILRPEKTYARKIRELILAYQIERKFSKEQILKMYFNEIPYGSNAYGAEAAAQIYFGKPVKELTLDECALLAALPKAPTYYSPFGQHQKELIGRKNYILEQMLNLGFSTEEEVREAQKIETLKKIKPKKERIIAPHFVMYVKEQLTEKYGHRLVEQGGLRVITTLDLKKQKIAEEAIKKNEENLKNYQATNAALVAIDVKSGEILALVGSKDYFNKEIDGAVNVALAPRQPGSSFKPVIYAKAFEKGYTPETILFDVVTNFGPDGSGKDYIPKNYDEKERGPVTMRQALAGSLNIPAVKTLYLTGLDEVLDLAERMGYTTLKDRSRFGLAIVLGGAEVKLLEHTAAFSIFAREGLKIPISSILKVEDSKGRILEEKPEITPEKIFEQQIARQINSILSDNKARAFIFGERNYLTLPDRPAAAKTGTTQNWRDAWTLGYTPSLAAGVWVGNSRGEEMKKGADGSKLAAPIWQYFMSESLKNTEIENFNPPQPEAVDKPILRGELPESITLKIDRFSGKLATPFTPASAVIEKKFRAYHSILHYLDKDNPRGPQPENPEKDPMYRRWEEGIRNWAKRQGLSFELPPTEYDDVHTPWFQPKVTIISPQNNETINNYLLTLKIEAQAPRGVRRIEVLLDGKISETIYSPPYVLYLNLSGFSLGQHKIIVRAYDDVENCGEGQINIYLSQTFSPKIIWLLPQNNQTIYSEQFPFTLSLLLPEVRLKEIKIYLQKIGQERNLIAQVSNFPTRRLNITWYDPLLNGQCLLFLEAIDENNQVIESETLNLTIL